MFAVITILLRLEAAHLLLLWQHRHHAMIQFCLHAAPVCVHVQSELATISCCITMILTALCLVEHDKKSYSNMPLAEPWLLHAHDGHMPNGSASGTWQVNVLQAVMNRRQALYAGLWDSAELVCGGNGE